MMTNSNKTLFKGILSISVIVIFILTLIFSVLPNNKIAYGSSEKILDDNGNEMYSVPVTLYDYKSDSEIYSSNEGINNYYSNGQYIHYAFEKFNTEIASYFRNNNMTTPLYFGDLNNGIPGSASYKFNWAVNRANRNYYSAAVQGIVDNKLSSNGNITQNGRELPYFSELFLKNTKVNNRSIGKAVSTNFPFRKTRENGVDYYEFSSVNGQDNIWLENEDLKYSSNKDVHGVWDAKHTMISNKEKDSIGFFPFNNRVSEGPDNNRSKLNFGFGLRFDIDFTVPQGGVALNDTGNYEDIIFEFAGDDDVWIFIDGILVLDIGGQHKESTGKINFNNNKLTAEVGQVVNSINGDLYQGVKNNVTISLEDLGLDFSDTSKEHTLTMFYMERGMIESNLKVRFNFANNNSLVVDKNVDLSNINNGLISEVENSVNSNDFGFTLYSNTTGTQLPASNIPLRSTTNNTLQNDKYLVYNKLNKENLHNVYGSTVDYSLVNSGSTTSLLHNEVVKINYKEDNRDLVKGKRVYITPENGNHLDISSQKYLVFDAYSNLGINTNIFVAIEDDEGNVSEGWINSSNATGWPTELKNNNWTKVSLDLSKLSNSASINYRKISKIYFESWKMGNISFDNIVFYKELADIGKFDNDIVKKPSTDQNGKFYLKNGESATVYGVFNKTDLLKVIEDENDKYKTNIEIKSGNKVISQINGKDTGEFLFINPTDESLIKNVTFTNTLKTGEIRITKNVSKYVSNSFQGYENDEFIFKIKLKDLLGNTTEEDYKEYNLTYSINGEEFTSNNGLITLRANETAIIKGIPKDTKYLVEEISYPERYKLESTTATEGKVEEEDFVDVKFTNGASRYDLIIEKTIDNYYYLPEDDFTINENYDDITGAEQSFLFVINQYDKPSSDSTRKIVNTFYEIISFKKGDTLTKQRIIKDLPEGYYEVQEDTNWSWKYEFKNVTVTPKAQSIYDLDKALAGDIYLGSEIKEIPKVSFLNELRFKDEEHDNIPEGDTAIETNTLRINK